MSNQTTDGTKRDSVRVYVEQEVPERSIPLKFEVLLHEHIATKDDRFETDIFQGEFVEEGAGGEGSPYPYEQGDYVVVSEHAIIEIAEYGEYDSLDPLFLPELDVGKAENYDPLRSETPAEG